MFWTLYLLTSIALSHVISMYFKHVYFVALPFLITLFLTPTSIEISETILSPAIFTFVFNVFLENDYSLRVLRPLFVTLPTCLVIVFSLMLIKIKFFPRIDLKDR